MRTPLAALALWMVTLPACGDDTPAVEREIPSEIVTQWNGRTELFLEYPARIAGKATGNWAVHLTRIGQNFRPVTAGRLTVTFAKPGSVSRAYVAEAPARAGIFTLDPVVPEPGTYSVQLALEGPQVRSVHVLPEVRVYASEEQLPEEPADEAAGGTISFLKEQAWMIEWRVEPAVQRDVSRTVSVPAEVVAPEGSQALVSAPANGIAVTDPNRISPSVGDWVRQGQILVTLAPTAEEGGYARIRENVERLEREAARARRLYAAGAAARKRLEEAEHELEVARAEIRAMGGGPDADYRFRVRAPISGQVASRDFLLGGRVQAGEPLFWLLDPTTIRLKAQVPAAEASRITARERASYSLEGSPRAYATGALLSVGSVVDSASRTIPVFYGMPNMGVSTPKVGQFVRAFIPVGGTVRGVAIPTSAVLDDGGIPVAYVQVGGESFERRRLRLGPGDGVNVVVLDGIRPGEMVVTTGAYQVRLASMSNTPMSGGHAH